jgi:hypothetical protein
MQGSQIIWRGSWRRNKLGLLLIEIGVLPLRNRHGVQDNATGERGSHSSLEIH